MKAQPHRKCSGLARACKSWIRAMLPISDRVRISAIPSGTRRHANGTLSNLAMRNRYFWALSIVRTTYALQGQRCILRSFELSSPRPSRDFLPQNA